MPVCHIPLASSIPVVTMDAAQRASLRQKLGIQPDECVIAYFGFITPAKGFDTLIQALRLLKDQGQPVKLLSIAQSILPTMHTTAS